MGVAVKALRLETCLTLLLLALLAGLCIWFNPGTARRLSHDEIDQYLGRLDGRIPLPPPEAAEALSRLRAWAAADDGRPVYMLNVMSYYERIRQVPGAKGIDMPPAAANAFYEHEVMTKLLKRGGYPVFAGNSDVNSAPGHRQSALMGAGGEVDRADRVLLVRYPSRRAFLELVCDPQYLQIAPYKFAALELELLPLEAEMVIPDPRWLTAGALLIVFLGVGWFRAARGARRHAALALTS
jgi:hypothetical protein